MWNEKEENEMKLGKRKMLLVSFMLFSLFFGAGNLIFPPFLGYEAGLNAVPAFLGFAVTAVAFPILGVAATAKAGGVDALCEKIHPKFSIIFSVAVYLCIGPMLAIPRTAGTSYSMFSFITRYIPDGNILGIDSQLFSRIIFSLIFFTAAGWIAKSPEKLRDLLGKIMSPILLTLIVIMFGAALMHIGLPIYEPAELYKNGAFAEGFLQGYQTMDTMAALVFGIVIAMNLKDMGINDGDDIAKETIRSGIIAGILILIIYGMITFCGVISGSLIEGASNGTDILTSLCFEFFGPAGAVLLAAIFFIACFNVCIGLICSCAEFFAMKFTFLSFDKWRIILTVWSFIISIAGLDTIISISVPVLSIIYPVAMVIIFMNLVPIAIFRKPAVQRIAVALSLLCGIISL